jgi:hypothetical protein
MTVFKMKRGWSVSWTTANPVLEAGEPGYEIDTKQIKVGDGVTPWNSLAYSGDSALSLEGHINSVAPHPVYDDGPDLVLLYLNAKV